MLSISCVVLYRKKSTLIYLNARLPNCTSVPIKMCFVPLFFFFFSVTHSCFSFFLFPSQGGGVLRVSRRRRACVPCLQQSSLPLDV